jgi:hypothetical protein
LLISPRKRKILKITAYILGSFLILLTAFHFWFIHHAESLIEDIVESKSNGKLKLHIKKFKFNWFSYDMELRNAVFYSTDTNTATTSYRFSVDKIGIRLKAILPLVFERKILIDSLRLTGPDVQVTKLRLSKDATTAIKDTSVSLPREMGKVYNSIQDALEELKVNRFSIEKGKFTLIDKVDPGEKPVVITNIDLHLDNIQVDSSDLAGTQKILFSDNVSLHTHHQDILFPDGRHRLSFGNFHINILKKMVEFDSCTIAATKSDSSKSSFSVFFDKLRMTNIDFDTLYQKEVIKADSVYCINPQFKLDVELEKRTGPRKARPRLDELIRQLTGDLRLAFVVVDNGSFDINTIRDDKPSSFTSDHNNFELRGLRIQKNAPRPLTVESFAMAIRNSENFLKDSTYSMQFDSILLINNSIYLSNFSFHQMNEGNIINSFSMPQFMLTGLSWDDLVFERRLSAERARLYYPVINYTIKENKKQNIFKTLAGIGDIIQLNNLDVANGQINIHFQKGSQLQLENASMSVFTQDLVASNRVDNLQKSIRELNFKKGTLRLGSLTARMENVHFTGNDGRFTAGTMYAVNKQKNFIIDAKNVSINKMIIDNSSYTTEINGIQWQQADIQITNLAPGKATVSAAVIFKNIQGANTKLAILTGKQKTTVFLQAISADEFIPRKNKLQLINLNANGKNFSFAGNNLLLTADRFAFSDHHNSVMENISFKNNTTTDSVSVVIPALSFAPDLSSMINGAIIADNVKLVQPVIHIKQFNEITGAKEKKLPEVAIGNLTIQQPELSLERYGNKTIRIEWHGKAEKNNSIDLANFTIKNNSASSVAADQLQFTVNNFSVITPDKTLTTGKGGISATITGLRLDSIQTDQPDWKGIIAGLQVKDILLDNIGKQAGRLEIQSARLNDLTVKSGSVSNFRQVLKENTAFRLKETTGQFDDRNNHFDWHNLNYDKTSKTLSVDSFTFRPTMGKDSFIASRKYQSDYIELKTGVIDVGPFDMDKYLTDTIINAGTVNIHSVSMINFRDKRKSARRDVIKPLPVNLLKKIPVHLSLDTVNLNNTNIQYSELNDKTNQTGTISIDNLKGKIFPVNNYNMQPGDSFRLEAEAWLMDSVWIALKLRESYTDSLAGFLMTANAKPADARVLNPVLIPLSSVKIESGFIDTLSMRVVGREYISMGEMKLLYHDLKIKFLNNGIEKKSTFLKGFATFLANNFVIKKNNRSRTGVVFFQRIRNKSTLNYLVKITLSGISSSVGVRKNKKLVRRYKKQLRKRNLPPIEYD